MLAGAVIEHNSYPDLSHMELGGFGLSSPPQACSAIRRYLNERVDPGDQEGTRKRERETVHAVQSLWPQSLKKELSPLESQERDWLRIPLWKN